MRSATDDDHHNHDHDDDHRAPDDHDGSADDHHDSAADDVGRGSGAVVFSSSLADEASIESSTLENGVFTHAVLRMLTSPAADEDGDGYVSVPELETSVKTFVSYVTGGLQHPAIERENIYQEIRFPLRTEVGSRGVGP